MPTALSTNCETNQEWSESNEGNNEGTGRDRGGIARPGGGGLQLIEFPIIESVGGLLSAVTVTSLTVVCPKLEAALKALPTGSVGNEQISAFIKTLNQYKAEVPPAQQAPINGMIEAYQALLDANTQAASDEAQQKVVAAATELTMACAAATQSPG